MIIIGLIVKPQGIKGEVKVLPITADIMRFQKLKEVLIDDTSFQVDAVSIRENFVYMMLAGITDRNAAETLRGKELHVERENAIKLPKGEYFIDDILGCSVFLGSDEIGIVKSIENFGSADVYTVIGDKTIRFPFLHDLLKTIDVVKKEVYLDPKRFAEVAVYED